MSKFLWMLDRIDWADKQQTELSSQLSRVILRQTEHETCPKEPHTGTAEVKTNSRRKK